MRNPRTLLVLACISTIGAGCSSSSGSVTVDAGAEGGMADAASGGACAQTSDCRTGQTCDLATHTCQAMLPAIPAESCSDFQEAAARVLFHVPRASDVGEDFYRLPFPNDIRRKDGKITLTGHPRPGMGVLSYDVVDRYIKAIEAETTGFSLNPAVYFRFSRNPSLESLRAEGAVTFHNITPGSPEYGKPRGQPTTFASLTREKYICPRWLVARHGFGAPLRSGETYAVLVKQTVTDTSGAPMRQDADFKLMLAPAAPADAELAAAWRAYTPLRAWIADQKVDPDSIAAAAVFTTDDVDRPMLALRAAVRAAPAPMIKSLVRCSDGMKSPCDDGKTGAKHVRGCVATNPAFDEYQGTFSIPIFQKGTPPYEQPSDGGGIDLDAAGAATVQRTEDVCFALSVPKGTPPAAGWPVMVYSHGTGGSYRSAIQQGLAADFAAGDVGGGAAVPMATFGYDGNLHGPRGGTSTTPVTQLVYNFQNPQAARDNAVQAAADLFAVARALEGFSAGGITLDPDRLTLYGHSQGGNAAANAVGFEPRYGAVVLSGTGGTLILSLLHKSQPVNIADLLPLVLGETKVDENDPVLNLLQMYLERADSVNFARRIFADPPPGIPARHVLHVFGTDDTFAPVETQRTFLRAADLDIVGPVLDPLTMQEISGMQRRPALPAPAHANYQTTAGGKVTAVEAQYHPGNYDGHFVSTENAAARRAIQQMLGTFVRDGVPTVNP